MVKKRVIWITGSMSAGKSTMRRMLTQALADEPQIVHQGTHMGKNYHITQFGSVAVVGKVKQGENGETSMCDGLDAVFGSLKKEGGVYSVDVALQKSKVVILEGSQTSPIWAHLLQPILQQHNADLYLVHLYLTYEQNFKRLKERQVAKLKAKREFDGKTLADYELTDKNIESLIGKNRQFNNCYIKVEGLCKRLQITATKSEQQIFDEIVNFAFADLI